MSMEAIVQKCDEIHTNFEQLKKAHKQALDEMATKGYVDPLLNNIKDELHKALDKAELALDAAEKAQAISKAKREVEETIENKIKNNPTHKAFMKWVKGGEGAINQEEKNLLITNTKELSTFTGPEGGYAVIPEFDRTIIKLLRLMSPMRQYAEVMNIGTQQFVQPYEADDFESGWIGELDERPETDTGTLRMRTWQVFEQYAMPAITQILLEDAFFDVEAYVTNALGNRFARVENTAFFVGNGVNQPRGILTYPDGDGTWETIEQVPMSVGGSAGDITYTGLVNLIFALDDAYQQGAVLMMNRTTVRLLRLMTDGFDNPIWSPGFGGTPSTIMDFPIVRMPDIPAAASGSASVIFGNFQEGYRILDRLGTSVLRDPYTRKGFIRLYTRKRVGGDVKNFNAIKVGVLSVS